MKKKLALALATVMAVSSLTACNNQPRTESDIRAEIAKLESELNNASGNSDNAEDTSTSTASNAPSSGNPYFDYGEYIHADPDRDPPVVSVPEQEYHYPDMFDVLPYIDETPVSKFEYKYNSSLRGMEITSYKAQSPKIRVPDTIEGEPVVKVDLGKFSGATHLYLPDTVTEVVSDSSCWGLEYTNIPSAFNWDKDWFFEYSKDLISVYFDNGITEIGNSYDYIFYDDFKGVRQFDAMTTITIPDTVTKSSNYDFYGCKNATIIYKGKSYTYSDKDAFYDLYKDINNFNEKGLKIEDGIVVKCLDTNSGEITVPDDVIEIGSIAFRNCTKISSVTLPEGLTKIGEHAFENCTNLLRITIPNSIIEIDNNAFSGCYNINATYKGKTYSYNELSSLRNAIQQASTIKAIEIADSILTKCDTEFSGSIVIPDGVAEIGAEAFADCTGLTSVSIPDSVTKIGKDAFNHCTGLTSVSIPDSVTEIGKNAFNGCTGLTSVSIPDSVTTLTGFSYCKNLTSITIPNSVTEIGEYAFIGCTGLTSVSIPDSVTKIGKDAFNHCTGLTSVSIPDSVTTLTGFSNCGNLTSVSIPDSVTEIGKFAFYNCKGLTSVSIPDSVTSIGESAFKDCTGLTSITIPDSVTEIGKEAFDNCIRLTNITIPDSVAEIGWFAFSNCKKLTSVSIPDSITEIGWCTFDNCKGLTSVSIPESVTSIDREAFRDCIVLTNVSIPDSVTSIGYGAFSGCTGLTNVTIPDSVTIIKEDVFKNCENIQATYKGKTYTYDQIEDLYSTINGN